MNCHQAQAHLEDFFAKTLSSREAGELQDHLDHCHQCRLEYRREQHLMTALRGLPVPPPSADFISRTLATARTRANRRRARQAMPYWGGALAVCLSLWLVLAGPFRPQPPAEPPARQAIQFRLHEQRLVQVMVAAPRDMLQALVVITLPPQVELAGFPGHREIRWHTDLHQGSNLLNLPLIARSEGMAELVTHINHENKSKMLSLVMHIAPDEISGTFLAQPPRV